MFLNNKSACCTFSGKQKAELFILTTSESYSLQKCESNKWSIEIKFYYLIKNSQFLLIK